MSNAVTLMGELTVADKSQAIPTNASLTSRYDDYILTSTIPGQTITLDIVSGNTANYDPVVQIYQLAPGVDVPLSGQAPLVLNDDRFPGNLNPLVTFTGDGVSRYLVRVTSFQPMPDTGFPPVHTLPAAYQLNANVPLGDINVQTVNPSTTTAGNRLVYRFIDWATGAHIYTANQTEIDNMIRNKNQNGPEGTGGFKQEAAPFSSAPDGNLDIIRFLNPNTGTYFYTGSDNSVDIANAHNLGFLNQGLAFKVYNPNISGAIPANAIPIYRFLDLEAPGVVHFYTHDPAERDNLLNNLSFKYRMEGQPGTGIAFYGLPPG